MHIHFSAKSRFRQDVLLWSAALLLTGFGFLAIHSATYSGNGVSKKLLTQAVASVLGLGLAYFLSRRNLYVLKNCHRHLYLLTLLVLGATLLFGIGKAETGASSWIRVGSIGIQPSEPLKVLFVLVFAKKIANASQRQKLSHPKTLLMLFLLAAAVIVLIILQNDTGTALVYLFMFCTMLFIAGVPLRYAFYALIPVLASLPVVWQFLAPYQKNRILVFLRPETDLSGAGYQVLKSKLSIASGGLSGRGFLSGPQNRLSLLPEKETDFIFGVISEEFGFFGSFLTVLLLFFLIFRILYIGANAKKLEEKLIAAGLGSMFLFQATENICMCAGLLPVTGIPLPFLSYGGSSALTSWLAIGMIQNIYKSTFFLQFFQNDI